MQILTFAKMLRISFATKFSNLAFFFFFVKNRILSPRYLGKIIFDNFLSLYPKVNESSERRLITENIFKTSALPLMITPNFT